VPSLTGQLLVASPGLYDPNFRRTVVLVTEHNEDGAAGLVLNRPTDAEVSDVVPQLESLVDDGERLELRDDVGNLRVRRPVEDEPSGAVLVEIGRAHV